MNIENPQTRPGLPQPPTPTASPTPPAVSVVDIVDPTAAGENIPGVHLDAVQLVSQSLHARRVIVRLDRTLIVHSTSNTRIRTHTVLQNGLIGFVTFGPRAAGTANGLPVGPGRILASPAGVELEFVVDAGYESIAFLVSPDDIQSHLHARHLHDTFSIPPTAELLQACPDAASALYQWARRLVDLATKRPEIFDLFQTQMAAQAELFDTLLSALHTVHGSQQTPCDQTRQSHGRIVRIAEEYALSHIADRPSVTNLCEAAGVSERTLQNAFKNVMGMTPVAYLARVRLHKVRQALRSASPHSTTVTAEALKCGFWHFGDFTRAYKACFGDLPSDTLRHKLGTAVRKMHLVPAVPPPAGSTPKFTPKFAISRRTLSQKPLPA